MRFSRPASLVGVLLFVALSTGCASAPPRTLVRYEFSQPQMGVPFRIVLYAGDEATATAAAISAFARIKQLNDLLSDYDSDSELSRLSQTSGSGKSVPVGSDLWVLLIRSQALAEQTGGAFDVTVGPVVNLWRKARREKKFPRADLLTNALHRIGYKNMRLDRKHHAVELVVPEMRLDLGAMAKGYAADEALKTLRRRGVPRALVAAAGDLAAGDPPPGKNGWRIELAALDVTNSPSSRFVVIANKGLSTSGDVFQHVELDGVRYSHIINPLTGIGLTDHSLVTVIARDDTTADSLATAVSVMGPREGLRLIEKTPGTAVRILRRPGTVIESVESKGFRFFYERGLK